MTDSNLPGTPGPDVTTPQTFDQQVEDISNLLEDPATDLPEDDQDEAAAEPEKPVEDDDPLGLEVEAEDVGTDDAEATDGSEAPEYKGGQFVPDTGKVTLDDGTTITVAELKRNNLFQRDYTKKTTELKTKETEVETLKSEVSQRAQQLDQFQEYASWYAEQHLPKQPAAFQGDPQTDPMGYLKWTQERDRWLEHVQAFQAFQGQKQAEDKRKQDETQRQAQERIDRERDALLKAMPILKDPKKGSQAWDALKAGAIEHYGLSEQEFNTIADHRILVGLRDGLAYRRIKAKAPQVQAQVAQKPVKSGRRVPANVVASKERQIKAERLRNSGSMEDAVAALQDLDL